MNEKKHDAFNFLKSPNNLMHQTKRGAVFRSKEVSEVNGVEVNGVRVKLKI